MGAVIDVTDATFEKEVLDRSEQAAVVVDLWAPWCGPCRVLGPVLEKVVDEADGQVVLTKVNVDENPMVSQAFQVQSIPSVFAIRDRKVVDHFLGALPEPAVREWVGRLLPSDVDRLVAKGDEASLRAALDQQADHPGAVVALAELLAGRGEQEEALALLERVPETAEVRRVKALARVGAEAATATDEIERELDSLLDRVKTDEDARRRFVDLLEVLGPDDDRTPRYRRALAARLY